LGARVVVVAAWLALLPVAGSVWAEAKDASGEQPEDIGYNLSIRVETVMVTATVIDRFGRLVPDLKREDFQIFEDGVLQELTHFSNERTALKSVVMLLDVSGSMRILDKITMAKIFAGEFCGRCHGKVAFNVPTGCPRCHPALGGVKR